MKTIRLLYPDYVSGGLDTYHFGANLLAHILPQNDQQALIKVKFPLLVAKKKMRQMESTVKKKLFLE